MFRVVWLQTALDELAAAWLQADSTLRQAITTAAHQIDLVLGQEPQVQGESQSDGRRVLFELPLGLTYEVREQVREVRILHVWIVRSRGRP